MIDNREFLAKLQKWQEAKQAAKAANEMEANLREELFKEAFPVESAKEDNKGTFYEDLPNNWKLQAVMKMTASLDEAAVPAVKEKLLELKVPNVDTLFKYKPSLVAAEYKKLTQEARDVVDIAISEKPAKVVLELIAPKVEESS